MPNIKLNGVNHDAVYLQTVATYPEGSGRESVCVDDDLDIDRLRQKHGHSYVFVDFGVYLRCDDGRVECIADCVTRDAAQLIGRAVASQHHVELYDFTFTPNA